MPVNWYAALVLIVLLGIGSVVLARYNYGKSASSGTQPTVGQTWHAALAFDICGKAEPAVPASATTSTGGLTTTGSGILLIAPKTSTESGNNATLGKFASEYTGMTLTDTSVQYPGTTVPAYKNGEKCAAGTPDAGQKGVVRVRTWVLGTTTSPKTHEVEQVGGHYASHPAKLKFLNRQLITVGFGPATASLPKVPATTTLGLLQAIDGNAPATTTTTTAPTSTSTTAAGSTTTAPTTTSTTAAGSTTTSTTAPATTTTTKPKS